MSSVGELLDQANLRARDLLYEAPDRDGRALARTWGEVVEAAAQLWRAIPAHRGDAGASVVDQLEVHARQMHRKVRSGSGTDPDLQEIAELLTRAAEAITSSRIRRLPTEHHVRDAFAARVSLMHTLHVSSHAVVVSLRTGEEPESFTESLSHSQSALRLMRQEMGRIEDLALSYHQGAYPEALMETHRDWVDPDRLGSTVSAWDVGAQRALTAAPTAAGLAHVANTQMASTVHAAALWRVAAEQGMVSPEEYRRVRPVLEAMVERWSETESTWQELSHPTQVPPAQARLAGTEMRAAFGQLARDRVGAVKADVLSTRVDMTEVLRGLSRFHLTSAGLAETLRASVVVGHVAVDARRAQAMLSAFEEKGRIPEAEVESQVSPRLVHLRRETPLPAALRRPLGELVQGVRAASLRVVQETGQVASRLPSPPPVQEGRPAPGRPAGGRLRSVQEKQERRPETAARPPARGCDR